MGKKRFKYSDFCQTCRRALGADEKIVHVEEETNRYFCSEECIRGYYDPMAEHYRREMLTIRDPHDIAEGDFAEYESYAPLCLSNPDEIWMEQTEFGEVVTYFLANFTNEGGKFTYVLMCFCLDVEPTYILLSFPTRDRKLVEEFRRGEKVEMQAEEESAEPELDPVLEQDFLARQGSAIEEEMMRFRRPTDIKQPEFEEYSHLLDQTIENPSEVWELQDEGENTLLTLISQEEEGVAYIVICAFDTRAGEGQESWKVVYSFPTNDPALVQHYRRGVPREGVVAKASLLH